MNVQQIILAEYRALRGVPFAWGTADCVCFAAACAKPIIGRDPIVHLRGRYDSEVSARRVMVEYGWLTFGDFAASLFSEIPVAMAGVGDWAVLANADGSETVGVVVGERVAAMTQTGIGQALRHLAVRAFRVVPVVTSL